MRRAPLLLLVLVACDGITDDSGCSPVDVDPPTLQDVGLVVSQDTLDVTDTRDTLLLLRGTARAGYEHTYAASVTIVPPTELDRAVWEDDSTLTVPVGAGPGTWRVEQVAVTYPTEYCSSLGGDYESRVEVAWSRTELSDAGYPVDVVVVNRTSPPGGADFRAYHGYARVDGIVEPAEWSPAAKIGFPLTIEGIGTPPATLYLMHSDDTLYVGLRFAPNPVGDALPYLDIWLDHDADGQLSDGDDFWSLARSTPGLQDGVVVGGVVVPDTAVGGTDDTDATYVNKGDHWGYELAHPLRSGDPHDITLSTDDVVPLRVRVGSGNTISDAFPGWRRLWLAPPHPVAPDLLEPAPGATMANYCDADADGVFSWEFDWTAPADIDFYDIEIFRLDSPFPFSYGGQLDQSLYRHDFPEGTNFAPVYTTGWYWRVWSLTGAGRFPSRTRTFTVNRCGW